MARGVGPSGGVGRGSYANLEALTRTHRNVHIVTSVRVYLVRSIVVARSVGTAGRVRRGHARPASGPSHDRVVLPAPGRGCAVRARAAPRRRRAVPPPVTTP